MERKNCWEVMNCQRQPGGEKVEELGVCPATLPNKYDSFNKGKHGGRFCWAIAGNLYGGKLEGAYLDKLGNCINCQFLKQVNEEEAQDFVLSPKNLKKEKIKVRDINDMAKIITHMTGKVIIQKAIGTLTAKEIVRALEEFCAGMLTKYIVWDLTEASLGDITSKEIKNIAKVPLKYTDTGKGGKMALVSSSDLDYGLGLIMESFMKYLNSPYELRPFRKMTDAADWFGVDSIPEFDGNTRAYRTDN
jgi:hypothetical protein